MVDACLVYLYASPVIEVLINTILMSEDQNNTENFIQKLPYSVVDKIITLKTHWISKN